MGLNRSVLEQAGSSAGRVRSPSEPVWGGCRGASPPASARQRTCHHQPSRRVYLGCPPQRATMLETAQSHPREAWGHLNCTGRSESGSLVPHVEELLRSLPGPNPEGSGRARACPRRPGAQGKLLTGCILVPVMSIRWLLYIHFICYFTLLIA